MANPQTAEDVHRLWNDKYAAAEAGARVAEVLGLKPDELGRYPTDWGPRNAVGLTRTVLDALELY